MSAVVKQTPATRHFQFKEKNLTRVKNKSAALMHFAVTWEITYEKGTYAVCECIIPVIQTNRINVLLSTNICKLVLRKEKFCFSFEMKKKVNYKYCLLYGISM